jgi:hypothetical protein
MLSRFIFTNYGNFLYPFLGIEVPEKSELF